MLKKFLKDETGLELSEYAVAAALITIAIATAFVTLGDNISDKITSLALSIGLMSFLKRADEVIVPSFPLELMKTAVPLVVV